MKQHITSRVISYPEPERRVLPNNCTYYYPALTGDDAHTLSGIWYGGKHEIAMLRMGLIHRSRDNAQAHAKALLGGK